jgi:hypothetical protein
MTNICDKAIHYWEHNGGTCLELGEDFGKQARIWWEHSENNKNLTAPPSPQNPK